MMTRSTTAMNNATIPKVTTMIEAMIITGGIATVEVGARVVCLVGVVTFISVESVASLVADDDTGSRLVVWVVSTSVYVQGIRTCKIISQLLLLNCSSFPKKDEALYSIQYTNSKQGVQHEAVLGKCV